jgi:hypothetical protein
MKIVGEQLESWALERKEPLEQDLFGRSALNRYYYSVFLMTRQMVGEFQASWKYTAHKEIPNLLLTSVKKKLDSSLKSSVSKGIINEHERSRIQTKHTSSVNELASLLQMAYSARLIADYEPEILIVVQGRELILDTYRLKVAKSWPSKAGIYCSAIKSAWLEAGIV